jgi:hypothetical protein
MVVPRAPYCLILDIKTTRAEVFSDVAGHAARQIIVGEAGANHCGADWSSSMTRTKDDPRKMTASQNPDSATFRVETQLMA